MSEAEEKGWRSDVESAPRDGSMILVNVKRRFPSVVPVRWRDDIGQMRWDGDHWWGDDAEITHWMPLPKPPLDTEKTG